MDKEKIGWLMLYSLLALTVLRGLHLIFSTDFWDGLFFTFLISWLLISIYLIYKD